MDWYCVHGKFFDNGKHIMQIDEVKESATKPKSVFLSREKFDEYKDYFSSENEALEFMSQIDNVRR